MELSLICLTILLFFNMGKLKKQDRRIRNLEVFVDDVNKAVADVKLEPATVDAAG